MLEWSCRGDDRGPLEVEALERKGNPLLMRRLVHVDLIWLIKRILMKIRVSMQVVGDVVVGAVDRRHMRREVGGPLAIL